MSIKKGEIYYADLSPVVGSEQGGVRPVLIIQNDVGNNHSPTTIVACITTRATKAKMPTHVWLTEGTNGLPKNSMVMMEQIRTIDKSRLKNRIGKICRVDDLRVEKALKISLGF